MKSEFWIGEDDLLFDAGAFDEFNSFAVLNSVCAQDVLLDLGNTSAEIAEFKEVGAEHAGRVPMVNHDVRTWPYGRAWPTYRFGRRNSEVDVLGTETDQVPTAPGRYAYASCSLAHRAVASCSFSGPLTEKDRVT